MKEADNSSKYSNMKGAHNKTVKGKSKYIPGMPKARAHQPVLSDSGPAIKIPKKKPEDITNGWNTPEARQFFTNQIKEAGQRSIVEHELYEKELVEKGRQIGMAQGLCIAIGTLLTTYDQPGMAGEIWRATGLSIKECEHLQVDAYDLDVIKEHRKELE